MGEKIVEWIHNLIMASIIVGGLVFAAVGVTAGIVTYKYFELQQAKACGNCGGAR